MNIHHAASTSISLFENESIQATHELVQVNFNGVTCTKHAKDRMEQRSIKPEWVGLVLEYGHEDYQKGRHTYSVSLDKAGIKKIRRKYGNTFELSKLRSLYVILTEDYCIVTCAYR